MKWRLVALRNAAISGLCLMTAHKRAFDADGNNGPYFCADSPHFSVFNRVPGDPVFKLQNVHRLYTRLVADMDRRLRSFGSAIERRILIEIGRNPGLTDAVLGRALGTDAGHLSRTLKALADAGMIRDEPSKYHAKQRNRYLTDAGLERARALEEAWGAAILSQRHDLTGEELRLVTRSATDPVWDDTDARNCVAELRELKPLDWGWVLDRARREGPSNQLRVASKMTEFMQVNRSVFGTAACHFEEIIGACFLVPMKEDRTIFEVVDLYSDPRYDLMVRRQMLGRLVENARDEAFRVSGMVRKSDRPMMKVYQDVGFKRRKQPFESNRFGILEPVYQYDLTFSLYPST